MELARHSAPTSTAPLLASIPETQRQLGGVHRSTVDELVRQGKLERVKVNRRSMITWRSIRALARARPND